MIAIALNALSVIAGSAVGILIGNRIKKSITDAIMTGIGLFTVYIGITGFTTENSAAVYLLALIAGGVTGTLLRIDDRFNAFSRRVQSRFSGNETENRFASGFAGFAVISGVGAFTIVASFNAGLGDPSMMYTKCVMDLVVSMSMASALGAGVLFACVPVVLYELALAAFAAVLAPSMNAGAIDAFSCLGAILTVAIGTNVAGITKFKVVNYLPALLFAPLFSYLAQLIL